MISVAVLCPRICDARVGLIEMFDIYTSGRLVLSIEGNALRLTDTISGPGNLRVYSTPDREQPPLKLSAWRVSGPGLTVLGLPLQDEPLLPSTRLDSLLNGLGISSSATD